MFAAIDRWLRQLLGPPSDRPSQSWPLHRGKLTPLLDAIAGATLTFLCGIPLWRYGLYFLPFLVLPAITVLAGIWLAVIGWRERRWSFIVAVLAATLALLALGVLMVALGGARG